MTAVLHPLRAQKSGALRSMVLLYFVIFSLGLCKLTWLLSQYLVLSLDLHEVIAQLCDWAAVFSHKKLPELIFFGLSLVALLLFWGLYLVVSLKFNFADRRFTTECQRDRRAWPFSPCPLSWFLVYLMAMLVNVGLVPDVKYLYLDGMAWLVFFVVLPLFLTKKSIKSWVVRVENQITLSNQALWVITALVTFLFGSLFVSFVFQPMQIANEFMDVPEQTRFANGQQVDNTQYINQHHIGGLHLYDPRHDHGVMPAPEDLATVQIPDVPALDEFLKAKTHDLYFYDPTSSLLSIKGRMTQAAYFELLEIYHWGSRDS